MGVWGGHDDAGAESAGASWVACRAGDAVTVDPTRHAALLSALVAVRDEAEGFSQRQGERRGFSDACSRMNRISEIARRVLKAHPDLDTAIAMQAENELRAACDIAASWIEKLLMLVKAKADLRVIDFHNALVPMISSEARSVLAAIRDAAPKAGRR